MTAFFYMECVWTWEEGGICLFENVKSAGFVMVTTRDRRIRLQKEHRARGWGHMVLPSAGIAREQVATLRQGHDCLRFAPPASL